MPRPPHITPAWWPDILTAASSNLNLSIDEARVYEERLLARLHRQQGKSGVIYLIDSTPTPRLLLRLDPQGIQSPETLNAGLKRFKRQFGLHIASSPDGLLHWVSPHWSHIIRSHFAHGLFPGLFLPLLMVEHGLERYVPKAPGHLWYEPEQDMVFVEPIVGASRYRADIERVSSYASRQYYGIYGCPGERLETLVEAMEGHVVGECAKREVDRRKGNRSYERGRSVAASRFYARLPRSLDLSEPVPDGKTLFECQREGVEWLMDVHRGVLAHDMGLGKTLTASTLALAATRITPDLRVVVVCPTTLQQNWKRQLAMLGVRHVIVGAWSFASVPQPPHDVPYMLIGDEAHKIQNPTSGVTRRFMDLANGWRFRLVDTRHAPLIPMARYLRTFHFESDQKRLDAQANAKRRPLKPFEPVPFFDWVKTGRRLKDKGARLDLKEILRGFVLQVLFEHGFKGISVFDLATAAGAFKFGSKYNTTTRNDDFRSLYRKGRPSIQDLLMVLKELQEEGLVEKAARDPLLVVLATGTPMNNGQPKNLLPLLEVVRHRLADDVPGFMRRYHGVMGPDGEIQVDERKASNLKGLYNSTRDIIQFRTKAKCLNLPPKTRKLLNIKPTREEQRRYDAMMARSKAGVLRKLMGNRSAKKLEAAISTLTFARKASSSAKVDAAIKLASGLIERGEKVVVFCSFIAVKNAIAKGLRSKGFVTLDIDGKVPETDRNPERSRRVEQFQTSPSVQAIVLTFGSAGEGITLHASAHMILVDRPWTPGAVRQAEDRSYRIGQNRAPTIYWLQAFDIDRKIDEVLQRKVENIELALAGEPINQLAFDVDEEGSMNDVFDALIASLEKAA